MSENSLFGFGAALPEKPVENNLEHVMIQRTLQRVLAFTQHTIDDVINDPIARDRVHGYFKLSCWIDRQCEIGELERQWNPLRHR
jgi:hypothetical protein